LTRGLYTSASGMLALQHALDATANNLANVATVGYKKDRAIYREFEDMLIVRLYDVPDGPTPPIPFPPQIVGRLGTGAFVDEIVTDFEAQGTLEQTERPLDVALQGPGFLAVETPNGERYTRAGQLLRNQFGELTTSDGHRVLGENGPVVFLTNGPVSEIRVTEDGDLYEGETFVDRLRLVSLLPGAKKAGYTLVDAAGGTVAGAPETTVHQGYLEQSAVNAIRETVELIQIQRAYEAGQKAIEAGDDALGRLFEDVVR